MADHFEFTTPRGRVSVQLRSEEPRILDELQRTYGRLRVEPGRERPDAAIEVRTRGSAYGVRAGRARYVLHPSGDGIRVRFFGRAGEDAPGGGAREEFRRSLSHSLFPTCDPVITHIGALMEEILLGVLSELDADLGCFHAGAFARDDHCVLLVGKGYAGKTTTSIAACSEGWRLIADDRSFVDLRDGRVIPIQRRPAIRRRDYGSFSLDPFLETSGRVGDEVGAYVKDEFSASKEWRKITDVVVLLGFAGRPALRELSPSRGLMMVPSMSVGLPPSVSHKLETLARCFRDVRWWGCELGDPPSSVRCLSERILHA